MSASEIFKRIADLPSLSGAFNPHSNFPELLGEGMDAYLDLATEIALDESLWSGGINQLRQAAQGLDQGGRDKVNCVLQLTMEERSLCAGPSTSPALDALYNSWHSPIFF
jgi:hypothetical protein